MKGLAGIGVVVLIIGIALLFVPIPHTEKHGIKAELTQFSGGPALADATMAGEMDIGSSGTATISVRPSMPERRERATQLS